MSMSVLCRAKKGNIEDIFKRKFTWERITYRIGIALKHNCNGDLSNLDFPKN